MQGINNVGVNTLRQPNGNAGFASNTLQGQMMSTNMQSINSNTDALSTQNIAQQQRSNSFALNNNGMPINTDIKPFSGIVPNQGGTVLIDQSVMKNKMINQAPMANVGVTNSVKPNPLNSNTGTVNNGFSNMRNMNTENANNGFSNAKNANTGFLNAGSASTSFSNDKNANNSFINAGVANNGLPNVNNANNGFSNSMNANNGFSASTGNSNSLNANTANTNNLFSG
jgi:hypothetical protein